MKIEQTEGSFFCNTIGIINSKLIDLKDCPLQESENAPEAYLEIHHQYIEGVKNISAGSRVVIVTWLHLANRDVLSTHRRNEIDTPEVGVFSTRSPDRPNPIGLHTVTIVEIISENHFKIFPIEVINNTPVIDIKPVLDRN